MGDFSEKRIETAQKDSEQARSNNIVSLEDRARFSTPVAGGSKESSLPALSIIGQSPFRSVEVPPDPEIDRDSWHDHLPYRKGVPGEYLPLKVRTTGDPRVVEALSTINTIDIRQRLEEISGARETMINGKPTRIESRSTHGGYERGLDYFKQKFEKDGYKVVVDSYTRWGETYQNLRAIKPGISKPNEVVMYGAHIDSTAGNPYGREPKAPGADDDGSGVVALSEIAEAIKGLPLDRTVVFSLFSGEEQGLWGSRAMVEQYKQTPQTKIVGMYQLDMIGYSPVSNTVESHDTSNRPANHQLTEILNTVQQKYNIDLKVYGAHNDELNNRSDHYPFLRNNIPAVLISEPYDTASSPNPTYHSSKDTVDQVNIPYVTNVAKLAAAAGVELAGLQSAPAK